MIPVSNLIRQSVVLLTTMMKSSGHHFTGPIELDVKKRIGLLWRPRRFSAHCNVIHFVPHVCRNILHCAYKIGGDRAETNPAM